MLEYILRKLGLIPRGGSVAILIDLCKREIGNPGTGEADMKILKLG